MRRARLFTEQIINVNSTIILDDKKSHYLTHVLRLKEQQSFILFNGLDQFDYHAKICNLGRSVELFIEDKMTTHNESQLHTSIYLALSKNEHIDLSIQKCTELGVTSIIIFNSEHTQTPLKKTKLDKKLLHWQRVAQSACEQCGRSIVPTVQFIPRFTDALQIEPSRVRIMLDFEGEPIKNIMNSSKLLNIDILLGAEGGLSDNEIQLAKQSGFIKVRLGPRILRTETAAITAMSLIQMLSGDLS